MSGVTAACVPPPSAPRASWGARARYTETIRHCRGQVVAVEMLVRTASCICHRFVVCLPGRRSAAKNTHYASRTPFTHHCRDGAVSFLAHRHADVGRDAEGAAALPVELRQEDVIVSLRFIQWRSTPGTPPLGRCRQRFLRRASLCLGWTIRPPRPQLLAADREPRSVRPSQSSSPSAPFYADPLAKWACAALA